MAAMRVALTGGIATGKSHCLRAFAALGVQTVDADRLAREAVEPGTDGLVAVVRRFGKGILRPDGTLDRGALGRLVFGDTMARRDLEAIIHPRVYAAIERAIGTGWAVVDIPLLYETGRQKEFRHVVVAACQPEQQLSRLMARDALSEREARQRIGAQLPLAEKVRQADFVIDTSGALADTDKQVVEVFERLRAEHLDEQRRPAEPSGR